MCACVRVCANRKDCTEMHIYMCVCVCVCVCANYKDCTEMHIYVCVCACVQDILLITTCTGHIIDHNMYRTY